MHPHGHAVPLDHFDSLAAGGGSPDTISLLRAGERSRRLLLLRAMLDICAEQPDSGPMPGIDTVWDILISLQDRAPRQFDYILMQPQTGMWIAHSLRRLHGSGPGNLPVWIDTGYIFNFVLAVAARAGIELQVTVPHRAGTVMIPTIGMIRLTGHADCGIAEAAVLNDRIRLRTDETTVDVPLSGESEGAALWNLRQIRSQAGDRELVIWLDDIDPYRQVGEPVPPERLTDSHVRRWQSLLDDAWVMLAQDNPPLAAAMTVGFDSLVPLPATPPIPIRSASSGDSFGSALISMPPDPTTLAVTLVHEFQHIKLGGLIHLLRLCQDDSRPRFYAPWRDDPRPLSGLLQGVYAFLGVTGFWRIRRSDDSVPSRDFAEFEFAFWRGQTWHALQALRADSGLTDLGRRFVAGMAAQLDTWRSEGVDPRIAAAAQAAADDHRTNWRIRHLRPYPGDVAALARSLEHGRAARLDNLRTPKVIPDLAATWSHRRITLTRLRFSNAEGHGLPHASESSIRDLPAADAALVAGDHQGAAEAYASLLGADPGQAEAWTGLVLAFSSFSDDGRRLLAWPELLPAIHGELRMRGPAPDPRVIAEWLRDSAR